MGRPSLGGRAGDNSFLRQFRGTWPSESSLHLGSCNLAASVKRLTAVISTMTKSKLWRNLTLPGTVHH